MNGPQLLMVEFFSRVDSRPTLDGSRERPRSVLRRLTAAVWRAYRQQSPPPASDHLRRDIGLEPLPKTQEWFWPW